MDRHCEYKKCNKGKPSKLVKRDDEHQYHFDKRKFCNSECCGASRIIADYKEVNNCLFCGEKLIRKDGEPPSQFNARKFCNKGHATSYRSTDEYLNRETIETVIDFKAVTINTWLTT